MWYQSTGRSEFPPFFGIFKTRPCFLSDRICLLIQDVLRIAVNGFSRDWYLFSVRYSYRHIPGLSCFSIMALSGTSRLPYKRSLV